jgi:hypothetical protein
MFDSISSFSSSYGDIVPITPIGRVIACLCALFGSATIGMLVSVLVDRYQRVYSRKLLIKEDVIDFDGSSDEENNDTDSSDLAFLARHQENSKIEDPDARAKKYAERLNNNLDEVIQAHDSNSTDDENSLQESNNRLHFIVGYVDNENHETSRDLVEKLSSIVADKQSLGDDISLNIIQNENNLEFQAVSSDDDSTVLHNPSKKQTV